MSRSAVFAEQFEALALPPGSYFLTGMLCRADGSLVELADLTPAMPETLIECQCRP